MGSGARRSRRGQLVVATAALFAATACGGGGEDVDVNGGGDSGGQSSEGGTLIAGISAQPDQLDPHNTTAYASFQVLENVYDTLVVPTPDGTFEPSLATEWETSEDGLTWTFTLRDDVTFHDGSEFDSADVVYSFERMMGESAVSWRFASVDSIEAPDATTFVVNLKEPTPALLANVGGYKGTSIISDGAAEEFDLATEANGTGPFTLESVDASGVVLNAYADHWNGAPKVDGVEFQFTSESTAALTALRSGEIHWTDNVPPQDIESLGDDEEVELGVSPSVDYWYMALNLNKEPWNNRDARRGIAFALDRESIAEAAKFGAATVNQTAIPEDSKWYHDYAPYEHDPAQAQALLDSAGVEEGQKLGLMVTEEYPETVEAAQVIKSNLAEVGVEVTIQNEPFSNWLDRQGKGDFDSFMLGWLGNLDPFGFYHAQHLCDGGNNFHGYCNEDVDELLKQAAAETDADARKGLYDQAAEIIVDDASYIYLYNPDVVQAWASGLEGYEVRADRAINFENVTLPE